MLSWNKSADRVAIVQMNAQLRDAQLELLSAHCATDRIRFHFSTEDIARHGERDILRKIFAAATALHNFYSTVEKQISNSEVNSEPKTCGVDEQQVLAAITRVSAYLRAQREQHLPAGKPLGEPHQLLMKPFFSPVLLRSVKIVELNGRRVPKPSFYEEWKAQGILNLPDITHMPSLTFEDMLVFNDTITDRSLFHALVHTVQFRVLGLQHYVELFVRSFVTTQFHFNVPLEAHAYTLECRFAGDPTRSFSVEEQVRLWANQRRY